MDRQHLPARSEDGLPIIDPETPWYQSPFFRRVLTAVLPPLGWLLLWRNRNLERGRKVLGAVGIAFYLVPYAGAVIGLLVLTGVVSVEWKGGFGPSLVRQKTAPNYLELDRNRTEQQRLATPLAAAAETPPAYWTDFRGPQRDGVYVEQPILTDWPASGPPLRWQQPSGGGYASFVVGQERAFTIEQRRDREVVAAYDLDTGREVWAHAYPAHFDEWMGGDGPRATPTYHQGMVYSLGATGEFCCLGAANGRVLWQKNILADNGSENLMYGLATSPLVVGDKVIVLGGGATPGKAVMAYHRLSGSRLWSVLDDKQAYTSPQLVTLAGERQVLVVSAIRAMGLAPDDGRLLWDYPWRVQYDNSISLPVVVGTNRFVISAGYGAGCALVEVVRTHAGFAARELWRNRNLKNKFNASVLWQGFLYGLDEGVLTCLDPQTGQRQWREGYYGYGQLLAASGHLLILGGEGELALVRADPQRRIEVARVRALTGKTWNVPALAHGRLLVRNGAMMACYDLRLPAAKPPAP